MVVTITNTLEMTNAETKAYLTLERLHIKKELSVYAASMVSCVGKLGSVSSMTQQQKIELIRDMARVTTKFKNLRR